MLPNAGPSSMEKQNMAKGMRTYKVVDVNDAALLGAKPFSNGSFNQYALVAVRGGFLDNVIAWGMKREPLQAIADKRNVDIQMLGRMMGAADAELSNVEVE